MGIVNITGTVPAAAAADAQARVDGRTITDVVVHTVSGALHANKINRVEGLYTLYMSLPAPAVKGSVLTVQRADNFSPYDPLIIMGNIGGVNTPNMALTLPNETVQFVAGDNNIWYPAGGFNTRQSVVPVKAAYGSHQINPLDFQVVVDATNTVAVYMPPDLTQLVDGQSFRIKNIGSADAVVDGNGVPVDMGTLIAPGGFAEFMLYNNQWYMTAGSGGPSGPPPIQATTATAGSPATFLPVGAVAPFGPTELLALTADPQTPWLQGQWVQAQDGTQAYWDGTSWQYGVAPIPPPIQATTAIAGSPATFLPPGAEVPPGVPDIQGLTADPQTTWLEDQWVEAQNGTQMYWEGLLQEWRFGKAPLAADTVVAGSPATYLPTGAAVPLTSQHIRLLTVSPTTHWAAFDFAQSQMDSAIYWDGSAWQNGVSNGPPPLPPATEVVAGAPATFLPAGCAIPRIVTDVQSLIITPTTPWTPGQWAEGQDGLQTYWAGSYWNNGKVPILATEVVAGIPATYLPAGCEVPQGGSSLGPLTVTPTTPWTTGQYAETRNLSRFYWDGTYWQNGEAP